MSEGPNLAAQQQAMNHGKGGGGPKIDLTIFNRGDEFVTTLMHGKGSLYEQGVNFKGSVSMDEIGYRADPGSAVSAMGRSGGMDLGNN